MLPLTGEAVTTGGPRVPFKGFGGSISDAPLPKPDEPHQVRADDVAELTQLDRVQAAFGPFDLGNPALAALQALCHLDLGDPGLFSQLPEQVDKLAVLPAVDGGPAHTASRPPRTGLVGF